MINENKLYELQYNNGNKQILIVDDHTNDSHKHNFEWKFWVKMALHKRFILNRNKSKQNKSTMVKNQCNGYL